MLSESGLATLSAGMAKHEAQKIAAAELIALRAENATLKQDAIAHDLIEAENARLKAQVQRDETVCHGHCQIVGQENEALRAQVARVEKLPEQFEAMAKTLDQDGDIRSCAYASGMRRAALMLTAALHPDAEKET